MTSPRAVVDFPLQDGWLASAEGGALESVAVPGLFGDPGEVSPGPVWYRRSITLPEGDWTHATLRLQGARFLPRVYINDTEVASSEGGMAPVDLALSHPALVPGATISLAIRLASLEDVPTADASRIPDADLWRSSLASYLWDEVHLRLHRAGRINRVIPRSYVTADQLEVKVKFSDTTGPARVLVAVESLDGHPLAEASSASLPTNENLARITLPLHGLCPLWSPESPVCHRLRVTLIDSAGGVLDERVQTWGHREVTVDGRRLLLNGHPLKLRGHSVVWHRWCRDPEARTLAWNTAWFDTHIVNRLKTAGANLLRPHLGLMPDAYHELCDHAGLAVQGEWIAFHGMPSSNESLLEQWEAWLDTLLRHPSTLIFHPWNETNEKELARARTVLEELERNYAGLVIAHRDTIHVHKYWWSLFENVGCYYDSANDFSQPVISDEFGGNYLDGNGDPGAYPTVRESLLRFLGPGHTRETRLRHQAEANARVAEYWRRLDITGVATFCALSSPADGNTHFLSPLRDGRPKPVWAALAATYAPVSLSIDVWDRDYTTDQTAEWPLHLFNETADPVDIAVRWGVRPETGEDWINFDERSFSVPAHGHDVVAVNFTLPDSAGAWRLSAILVDKPTVESSWRVRTLAPLPTEKRPLRVDADESELAALCLSDRPADDATLWLGSRALWKRLADGSACEELEAWLSSGRDVVLLDAGPVDLGKPGPLDGSPTVKDPRRESYALPFGARILFNEAPEPESCFHLTEAGRPLGEGLPADLGCLWNGLRGGVNAPAWSIDFEGMGPEAFLQLWEKRGADPDAIRQGRCIAYSLADFYAFASGQDPMVKAALRERVRFLAADAPALEHCLNPDGHVTQLDLGQAYQRCRSGGASDIVPLAVAGKDLLRAVLFRIDFGPERGRLFLSQLITAGRLAGEHPDPEVQDHNPHYALRPDPIADRLVRNLLRHATRNFAASSHACELPSTVSCVTTHNA